MNEINLESILTTETPETVETALSTDRPFMTTPIDEYSVTEGLLLVLVLLIMCGFLWKLVKEIF